MKYTLRLYITGQSGHSQRAVRNLERICRKDLNGNYKLEVVDVLEEPERADADKILATPTLIKELPLPLRKLIGDMSDRERVLVGLDVERAEGNEDE
ncbi:MAG: circadian clock KaiB family protein [Polyangiales bacterium]